MNKLEQDLKTILENPFRFDFLPEMKPGSLTKASVLCLFSGSSFEDASVLLIKRSETVATHVGQVAFPGGGEEPSDQGDLVQTALRETKEELGLESEQISVMGALPGFQTVTGGYFVTPVLAWAPPKIQAHKLIPDANEVAHAGWTSVKDLRESKTFEKRMVRGVEIDLPVFYWKDKKMWGLSALIFDLILNRHATLKLC